MQEKLFTRPIVTEVLPLANYWPAEDYHQDFFERPDQGYCLAVAAPKVAKFRKTFTELTSRLIQTRLAYRYPRRAGASLCGCRVPQGGTLLLRAVRARASPPGWRWSPAC